MNGYGKAMAKWTMHGLDEYSAYLQRIGKNTREILGAGIYAMADVVANEIRKGIQSLPEKSGVTKKGLEEGFGISPMQDENGYFNVKLGFDGYNKNGVPNVLMARIFESGTSTVQKHPFIRPAVNRSQKEALVKGQESIEEKIKQVEK